MPATILPFPRRAPTGPEPRSHVSRSADSTPEPEGRPAGRPDTVPTSRQIAHRWAMLSHLARHYPRREPPDSRTIK